MDPPAHPTRRRLAAVWFADIVGFSSLSHVDEDSALRLVEILQALATRVTDRHRGRVVKFLGDAVLSEFKSTEAAVRSAVELLESYHAEARSLGSDSTLRIGVHLGEVVVAGEDIYGDGVNTAARLQGTAEPGQVVVSEDVWRQLRMRPEFRFESKGEVELRGITARIGVFHVLFGAAAALASAVAEAEEPARLAATTPADPAAGPTDGGSARARRHRIRLRATHAGALVFLLAAGGATALWLQHPASRAEPDAPPVPPAVPVLEPDAAGAMSPAVRPSAPPDPPRQRPQRETTPPPSPARTDVTEAVVTVEPAEAAADPTTDRDRAISQCIAALDVFVLLVAAHTSADFAAPFGIGDRERAQLAAVYLRADGPVGASILSPGVRRISPAGADVDFVLLMTFREGGIPGSVPLPFRAALKREPAAWRLDSVAIRG